MFTKSVRLERVLAGEAILGRRQFTALKMVAALKPYEAPPKGAITSAGEVRLHTVRDLMPEFITATVDKGGVRWMLTPLGRKLLENEEKISLAKLPPSGYRKAPAAGSKAAKVAELKAKARAVIRKRRVKA